MGAGQLNSSYYDYGPTIELQRSVVISGFPGAATSEIAYDLASLTGLQLDGAEAYGRLEADLAPRALRSSPPALVLMSCAALAAPVRLQSVREQAAVVCLTQPATAIYWHLREYWDRHGHCPHPLHPTQLAHPADLMPLLDLCQPVVQAADLVIDLEGRGVHETVLQLQQSLPGIGGKLRKQTWS